MIIIGMILLIILISSFFVIIYRLIKDARQAKSNTSETKNTKNYKIITCEKCHQTFKWNKEEALVKYDYGTKYLVPCPYCKKLTTINIEV